MRHVPKAAMAENELAAFLGIDSRLAGDLLFAAPNESADRIRAAWEMLVGRLGDNACAREWFVTANVALGGRTPVELWLKDGFAAFESVVEATVF